MSDIIYNPLPRIKGYRTGALQCTSQISQQYEAVGSHSLFQANVADTNALQRKAQQLRQDAEVAIRRLLELDGSMAVDGCLFLKLTNSTEGWESDDIGIPFLCLAIVEPELVIRLHVF